MIDYAFVKSKINKKGTILMIPGFAHTKEHYLKTPDKREGWAYNFAKLGYNVYVINWPGIKSGTSFGNKIDSKKIINGIASFIKKEIKENIILFTHSASGAFGWKLAELLPQIKIIVGIAPGPIGNIQAIQKIKPILMSGVKMYKIKQYSFNLKKSWEPTDFWVKNKLIGASKHFPINSYKEYKASLISVPSKVIYERMNINGSQIKVNPKKIKKNGTKIFIFTGTKDHDHTKKADGFINDWFIKNDIKSEFHWLGDDGFVGNGHMLMLEKNSKQIAEHIARIIKG